MKNFVKIILAAALLAFSLTSCQKDSISYSKLVYEATSSPDANMMVQIRMPKRANLFGTIGSMFKQDCGYVEEGYQAEIISEVIKNMGPVDVDATVTVKIYLDDVCVAQNSGLNSAALTLTVPHVEPKK